jgi:hypothetical protein
MTAITYRCPIMRQSIQYWLDEEDGVDEGQKYIAVLCYVCLELHFVERMTGKVLGEGDPRPMGRQPTIPRSRSAH